MTTTTIEKPAPRWNLDPLFPGGSASSEYAQFVQNLTDDIQSAEAEVASMPHDLTAAADRWSAWILRIQDISDRLKLGYLYALCLVSQNVDDVKAQVHTSRAQELESRYSSLESSLESFALKQGDAEWAAFVSRAELSPIHFYLDELRRNARRKMPEQQEKLALELAVSGYHAWHLLYEKMAGDLRVVVDDDGPAKHISLGQNSARLSHPDRAIRRDAFTKLEGAWESTAELAAMTLNSQAGFRLALYKNRQWDSALYEPLQNSRLQRETLDAMWEAISHSGPKVTEYIRAKCRNLGIEKFCWYDQDAPIGKTDRRFTFDEAGDFIVDHLGSFSDEMGAFTRRGLDERWVEAEDRPGKRAGGWCSWVPLRKQARIFMTFAGTYDALSTLAHEFGHAYHGFVLQDEPGFNQHYPMTLAETASIFNEMRVADAALTAANERDEKLALLDQKLQAVLAFFCNIRARFLFDTRFYAERKNGVVERSQLSAIMQQAQKEAFFGLLDEQEGYHPLFWASKLHFFVTDVPFYNYPYTFGFLFAKGVYNRALEEGSSFAKNYRALLADTGKMTTEAVAQRHLGVDLTKPDFWNTAVKAALGDVDEFVRTLG